MRSLCFYGSVRTESNMVNRTAHGYYIHIHRPSWVVMILIRDFLWLQKSYRVIKKLKVKNGNK